jgi:hypothetical protein
MTAAHQHNGDAASDAIDDDAREGNRDERRQVDGADLLRGRGAAQGGMGAAEVPQVPAHTHLSVAKRCEMNSWPTATNGSVQLSARGQGAWSQGCMGAGAARLRTKQHGNADGQPEGGREARHVGDDEGAAAVLAAHAEQEVLVPQVHADHQLRVAQLAIVFAHTSVYARHPRDTAWRRTRRPPRRTAARCRMSLQWSRSERLGQETRTGHYGSWQHACARRLGADRGTAAGTSRGSPRGG